jgi:hypothetical protein
LLLAVTLARAAGGKPAVLELASAHAGRHGESAELYQAVGEGALLAGDADLAVPALLKASGDPPRGPIAVRLATALLACGELAAARQVAAAVVTEQPSAGLVTLLCDLVEGRDSSLQLELTEEELERSLRAMLAAVRAVAHPDVTALLEAAAPAVAGSFPWFAEALGRSSPTKSP